jgi:hypothetical protein
MLHPLSSPEQAHRSRRRIRSAYEHHGKMDDHEGRRILSMLKTKHTAMTLALGIVLLLFSTAFAAAPAQTSASRTASSPQQFGWSGWSEVPSNGSTFSGPATTFYNGNDYVFVRGTNDHLYVNTFNGTTWSGWSEVPGHGLTPSAPAATRFVTGIGPTLYLFVRGTDNKIYLNIFNTISWSGWSLVPGNGSTPDAPGATAFFNKLYLFVRGTNNRIYVNILQIPA